MNVIQFISPISTVTKDMLFTIPVNETFNTCGDGYWSTTVSTIPIKSITIIVNMNAAGEYYNDLGVLYDVNDWDNSKLGLIYTDSKFVHDLREFLKNLGFPIGPVDRIGYSEQGMQDPGRVSFDADSFADYLRSQAIVQHYEQHLT